MAGDVDRHRAERHDVTTMILISVDGLAGFYWTDPRARMPTLRGLARRGAVATRMQTVFPSTTWPSHASLVTGVLPHRHGVVANTILNRLTGQPEDLSGDPVYDAGDLFRAPALYDVAHAAGRKTAAIDWPGTRHSPSLDFNLPFFKDQRIFEAHTAAGVWKAIAGLGHPVERMGEWADLSKRFLKDAMVADLAAQVMSRHAPDLMMVHFLSTDSFQHLYGPRSPEAYWAIEYVDERVARLLASLGSDGLERVVVAVVSDHGFLPAEREIRINTRLRQLGLLEVDARDRVVRAEARFVANLGAGAVYVLTAGNRPTLTRSLASELKGIEGIAHVWTEEAYATVGLPTPAAHPWMGDVLVDAEPGYTFVDDARNEDVIGPSRRYRGTHGQLPTHAENAALFIAAGPGIAPGRELGPMASVDVAPTLAALLGLEMDDVEGRALREILG